MRRLLHQICGLVDSGSDLSSLGTKRIYYVADAVVFCMYVKYAGRLSAGGSLGDFDL